MSISENSSTSLPAGTRLASPQYTYTIEQVIGAGGFGITYRAWATIRVQNIEMPMRFAIKEHFISSLCDRQATNVVYSQPVRKQVEGSLKDFISEARRLQSAGVSHPNIVKVNEVFEANNTAYYIMEYLEGESLQSYVKNRGGKLTEEQTLEVMMPILKAIEVLHANRLTHLDIKPDNIMITRTPEGTMRPVLIDFGLAKHYDLQGRPTSTINTLGCSAGYSPIEQYVGITTFSPTADIYALGATMLYCLSGKTPPVASQITPVDIESAIPQSVSPHLRRSIRASMAHNATNRPSSLTAMLRDLGNPAATPQQPRPAQAHSNPTRPTNNNHTVKIGSAHKSSKINSDLKKIAMWFGGILVFVVAAVTTSIGLGRCGSNYEPEDDYVVVSDSVEGFPLVCTRDGQTYYLTIDQWNGITDYEKRTYDKQGVLVHGNGEEFVLSLYDNGDAMTWDGAMLCYRDALPTKNQAEIMAENHEAINAAIRAFGGDEDPEWYYWTSTESGSSGAWSINMEKGYIYNDSKINAYKVRTVAPIPSEAVM